MGIKEGDTEVTIGLRKLIMDGDIILAFNDITYDVTDYTLLKITDFANSLEKKPKFEMTLLRGGKIIKLQSK